MNSSGVSSHRNRVIIHIDLDCFFVQVERQRNPSLSDKPFVVRQHQDIICVSYEARELGVKKHDLPEETQKLFPQVTLVHVFIEHGKVSLRPYREASDKVFECIENFAPNCDIEKASIDEVYVDVTDLVSQKPPRNAPLDTHTYGRMDNSEYDARLQIAATIANDIRAFIKEKFGFTSSAGVSHNKMLAKIASGMNKPHKQTIVTWSGVEALLASMPLAKLPKMGGKLGKSIGDQVSATHVSDLQKYSEEELVTLFGQKIGNLLHKGIDTTHVEPKGPTKSIVSGMSLNPINKVTGVEKIFTHLATDLVERMRVDHYLNKRDPGNLVVGIRLGGTPTQKNHSIVIPKRRYGDDPELEKFGDGSYTKTLVSSGMSVFMNAITSMKDWSVTRLSLVATNFNMMPTPSAPTIQKYFSQSLPTLPTNSAPSITLPSRAEKRVAGTDSKSNNKRPKVIDTSNQPKMKTLDAFFKKM